VIKKHEHNDVCACTSCVKAIQLTIWWNYGVNVAATKIRISAVAQFSHHQRAFLAFQIGRGFHLAVRSLSDAKYRDLRAKTSCMQRAASVEIIRQHKSSDKETALYCGYMYFWENSIFASRR